MKILKILLNENAMDLYRDLTANQNTVLNRVVGGKVTFDTASPREQAVMDELVDLGLLDMAYEPTKLGRGVSHIAGNKHGSYDGREIQRRMAALGREPFSGDRSYTAVGDRGDELDSDVAAPVSGDDLRGGSIMGKTRVGRDDAI